jgi:hypothetical protein
MGIRFRERAMGTLACRTDHGRLTGNDHLQWEPLSVDLMARVHDIDRFIESPDHRVGLERGTVRSGHFGRCEVTDGAIDLLVRVREPDERELRYRVCFTDQTGRQLTIFGYKDIRGRRFRVWYDTTRIFIELYEGTLHDDDRDRRSASDLVGVGVLEIPVHTFALQFPTIRAVAPLWLPWVGAYVRFVWFFSKSLTIPYWKGLLRRRRRGGATSGGREPEHILDLARRPGEGANAIVQDARPGDATRASSTTTVGVDEGAPEETPSSG